MQKAIMTVGFPASGKSSAVKEIMKKHTYAYLSRDKEGGRTLDLLPKLEASLKNGNSVVLDCTFMQADKRKPFIEMCKKHDVPISCLWMSTSVEDCQINALQRMMERYGKVFYDKEDLKEVKKDPNMFPISVFFKMKKEFEKPTKDEGFENVEKRVFRREPREGFTNKAIFLDYDGTLRETVGGNGKYPTKPTEIKVRKGAGEVLRAYKKLGYYLIGVSNQSGIAKGELTEKGAELCFEVTNATLAICNDVEVSYCPHKVPPVSCYCRKPQSGMAIPYIYKYKLNVSECIMVGDQTTDKTFAKRLGMQFMYPDSFFAKTPVVPDEPEEDESFYTIEPDRTVTIKGGTYNLEEVKKMFFDLNVLVKAEENARLLQELKTDEVDPCVFCISKLDPYDPEFSQDCFSFAFRRESGELADSYYDAGSSERQYLCQVFKMVGGFCEEMENTYGIYGSKSVEETIQELKGLGLEQVDQWWED